MFGVDGFYPLLLPAAASIDLPNSGFHFYINSVGSPSMALSTGMFSIEFNEHYLKSHKIMYQSITIKPATKHILANAYTGVARSVASAYPICERKTMKLITSITKAISPKPECTFNTKLRSFKS